MNSITPTQKIVKGSAIFTRTRETACEEIPGLDLPNYLKQDPATARDIAQLQPSEENWYIFAEFRGIAGKTLLESILSAILPAAQMHIWDSVMSFGGPLPYPGTQAIMKQSGRALRTVQQNLKALRDRDFLCVIPGPVKTKNGEIRGVKFKDFSGLYRFAHEYYEWTQTLDYQRYQAEREDCERLKERHNIYEAMCADNQLLAQIRTSETFYQDILLAEYIYRKVSRFENYQRHLHAIKDIPQEDIERLGKQLAEDMELFSQTPEPSPESLEDCAPYILNNNSNKDDSNLDSNHLSTVNKSFNDSNPESQLSSIDDNFACSESIEQITPIEDKLPSATLSTSLINLGDNGEKEEMISKIAVAVMERGENDTNIATNTHSLPLQPVSPRNENLRGQNAKRAVTKESFKRVVYLKNGKEYRSTEELKAANDRYKESQARLQRCERIADIVRYICRDLNDKSPQSTPTTVCKIYEESGLSEEEFLQIIHYAREHVRKLYNEQVTSKDEQGKTKRVPLFIKEIRKAVKEGVDVLQARDEASTEARLTGLERAKRDYELAHPSKPFWEEPSSDAFCEEDEEAHREILRNEYKKLFPGRMETQDDPVSAKETNDQETSSADITLDQDAACRASFSAGKRADQEDAVGLGDASSQNQDRLPDQPFLASGSDSPEKERKEGVRLRSRSNPLGLSMAEIWPMADEIWHHAMKQALLNLHQATGLLVIYHEQACRCGGHLATITSDSRRRCLSCENPPKWNRSALDSLQAYLEAQVPEPEECLQQVLNRLGLASEEVPDYDAYLEALSAREQAEQVIHDGSCSISSEQSSVSFACF